MRTKDNIARVRRDEAQAEEELKQKVLRAKLAEQEARTSYLRTAARLRYDGGYTQPQITSTKSTPEANIYTSEGNINLFRDLEEGKRPSGANPEHEAEKKAEQEKYEKSIGYLTYLGQDSVEAKGGKAWYEVAGGRITRRGQGESSDDLDEVGLKTKSRMDPINDIIKYAGLRPAKKTQLTSISAADTTCNANLGLKSQKTQLAQVLATDGQYNTNPPTDYVNRANKSENQRKRHKKKHRKEARKSKKHRKRKRKESRKRKHSEDDKITKNKDRMERGIKRGRERSSDKRERDSSSDNDSWETKRRKTHMNIRDKDTHKRGRLDGSKSKTSSNSSSSSTDSPMHSTDDEELREKQQKLEVLRGERLRREAEERDRAEKLLAGTKLTTATTSELTVNPRPLFQQKYSSQFNPHIARQNQEPRTLEPGVKYWLY